MDVDSKLSSEKVSSFEFLLDESLLGKHLQLKNPDPSAAELVSLFWYQADVTASTVKEIGAKDSGPDPTDAPHDGTNILESRKIRDLRHLALRVACHLKWNLGVLCGSSVPLATVQSLLIEFLKVTSPEEDLTLQHPNQIDMSSIAPQALFALLLYRLWCLRTAVQESFPVRPNKAPNVQVPGILDPTVLSSNMKEAVLQSVREDLEDSVKVLESYVNQSRDVSLPKPESIGAIVHGDIVGHDWCLVYPISGREMSAQINYDLGSYYFHQLVYPKALTAFMDTYSALKQLKNPVFCEIDEDRLLGYLKACQGVVQGSSLTSKVPVVDSKQQSLLYQAEKALKEKSKAIVDILAIDNTKHELSLQYRGHVLHTVQNTNGTVYNKVLILNAVRLALGSFLVLPGLITVLRGDPKAVDTLIKNIDNIFDSVSITQKCYLKALIRYVHSLLAADTPTLTKKILSSKMRALFASENELLANEEDLCHDVSPLLPSDDGDISLLEQKLLVCYDPDTIKSLVAKLHPKIGKSQTMRLSDQWQVPRDLVRGIESLPLTNPTIQVSVFILIAKARLCLPLHHFEKAKELLSSADSAVKDVSFKLSKQLRLEVLRADISQHSAQSSMSAHSELLKRARSFLTSKEAENDLVAMICSFLLNAKDWDHFMSVDGRYHPCLQVSQILSALCRDLPNPNKARGPARDLWETISMIFTTLQPKRSRDHSESTGIMSAHSFTQFILQLKEPLALSAAISCVSKLLSLSKSLSTEISSDFISLWPAAHSNSEALNSAQLSGSLHSLLEYALTFDPCNASWLRTQADVCFSETRYSSALKHYLLAGHILSDAFSEPITKNVFSDLIIQRLIKCCSMLKCFTQVAVLCQCLDEVDHAQAFRALQEPTCNDAMDSFYSFLWDVNILEFLIYHHAKSGEVEKKNEALKLIGQMELNCSNPSEIQQEAVRSRKAAFFQALLSLHL